MALILIICSLSSIHGTLLSIRVDFKTKSIISIASSLLSGAIGIYCAYKGLGAWALVAQSVASATIITFLTLAFVHWMPKLVFSKESFKRLFSYSSKLLAASVISVAYDNAYPMVIGKRFTAADVGQYTRAGQFPGVANSTITSALNRVAFPVLSKIQDDDQRLLSVYEKYIQLSCFLIFPVLLWLCGCARPLVSFLLTDKWVPCVPYLRLFCLYYAIWPLHTANLNAIKATGHSGIFLELEIIKKVVETAKIPERATAGSAGYDMYAEIQEPLTIPPGKSVMIRSGIAMSAPRRCAGFIFARSGLSTKQGLRPSTCVSVIDADYRGEIGLPIYNDSDEEQTIMPHERIAQLVFIPVLKPTIEIVKSLDETDRGAQGFGSSGK